MICMLMHLFGHGHAPQSPYDRQPSWSSAESAREIVDRRYAGGEIAREEYERLKQTLDKRTGTS
jgi:uncharacterized membrane protein